MGKYTRRLITTVVAALVLVVFGVGLRLALAGNSLLGGLPGLAGSAFRSEPARTTAGPVTVGALRELNELATVEREDYVLVTRESGGTELGRIFTGEAVSLIAVGEVRAGVDLKELSEEDVRVDEATRSVTIDLPEPRILGVSLDEDQTEIYDRDLGPLNRGRENALAEEARDVAVERLEAAARESDILQQATENAQTSLRSFVQALGYEEVSFE
ncbi:DUF4230 domain-containing protein [Rubrobacter radiotolerans]|uniref:DUF4230 domain-containing protein n=1 Tax=Rubrobacter radiotolerans TaxID=42256 RepID=A0AB35T1H5_RUBRA|nr:DUF4230 domain-containing protein [Rubrobacter radiotolerans]MDX5893422.1 DUF4230 domain-containing protein [Rubrobacter radiotolerans]SMC03700.1 Protein of unknown function [Rubrobacter radiotolerans DSM 5868]